jgi:two-component system KDP operon response regulator KdpE
VLVCDDEPHIVRALKIVLREAGFEALPAETAAEALQVATLRTPDAAILDLVLPDGDGVEVCREIRRWSQMPIIVLSAVGEEDAKVRALEAGADDYVTKPFSVLELVSRVRALLRRRELDRASRDDVIRVGSLHLDIARHAASVDGKPLRLTVSEFRLLQLLASGPGQTFTRERLIKHLWDSDFVGDRRAIDVHISNLRRKLETDPRNPRRLVTVRGVGYKLVAG